MPQPRPLPRSLVPIPGDSLPRFLLRLSCRLNQPPASIAELTELAPHGASGAPLPLLLRPGSAPALLPARLGAGRPPAQCGTGIVQGKGRRPACCGGRLDQDGRRRPAGPALIALQDKIPGRLDPDGSAATLSAGMPASPASYFSDLRALALLACST